MKKQILMAVSFAFIGMIALKAQTPVLEVFANDPPRTLSTSVTNGIASTITWSEVSDPNGVVSLAPLTGTSTVATFNAAATVGQEAEIQAIATSATPCASDAKRLIIRIKDPGTITNTATIASAAQSICEDEAAAAFTINFNNANVTSFKYYLDLDNNNTMDGTETLATASFAAAGTYSLTIATTLSSNATLQITSVTGSSITSPSSVNQLITVNTKPVISEIQF